MIGSSSLRLALASGTAFVALCALPGAAYAQATTGGDQTTQPAATPTGAAPVANDPADKGDNGKDIIVTGSRIKQDPNNSALPLTIITNKDLSREGISSPEQLISYLANNGNGADNLASNSDVVSGAARGTNGLSAANLRGQGSAATLVLLNGRRVAAHGLQGSAVDVNQIPFAAIDRIEILKDGASAIYGTDAIGGVINFITKKNFRGIDVAGFVDVPEAGDSQIYRVSGTVGWGKLDEQGWNIMASVSKSWNKALFGRDRAFVNTNQPNRGLSVDTRGTPIATLFNIGANSNMTPNGTLLTGLTLTLPNGANGASGGINILDLPGGAGCGSVDGGLPYDEVLWANPSAQYACAWDTGRAATLQQPIDTLTYYGRGVVRIGGTNELSLEITGSNANSSKIFSNNQYSASATTLDWAYPLNALTANTYNSVFNALRNAFDVPTNPNRAAQVAALNARYGLPLAGRWRCMACGPREYKTNTKTFRAALGLEGTLFPGWDYRTGASYARSESVSTLGTGYHYRGVQIVNDPNTAINDIGAYDPRAPTAPGAAGPGIIGLINAGILNPFSVTQTQQAIDGLKAVSAEGTKLYGGKYEVKQFDASISGPLFKIWGGNVQLAVGVDYRRETYSFNGSAAAAANMPDIFNVAFDNINALTPKSRDVKAAYGEILFPIIKGLDVTFAGRVDDYTGFGSTFNPKVSVKFKPIEQLLFRASYNTGFRVPSFNQIFNGTTISPNPGNTLVDPTLCPTGNTTGPQPACAPITPDSLSGGNLNLGPETSKQYSFGAVIQPTSRFSFSADYWYIAVDNTIGTITIPQLLANIAAFPDRITRTNGIITQVDLRTGNFGSRRTRGIDFTARGSVDALGGVFSAGFDATLLLQKKEKLLPNLPYTNTRGVFTLAGDLGLRWKHNAYISYTTADGFGLTFSQIYRSSYKNFALPASATRPDYNPTVKPYIIYNASISQRINEHFTLTAGVKNVFNADPPFAITYDSNTGSGSSWEPRDTDPRGRSFTVNAEVKF
ncbi:TonB-dependent receptor [Sphingomonas sp.]|uniref:TonB-dependent receptor domain-containing protein n=1 Tax=Sphingomonas sp. TaxID=28214 RepID=UPI0025E86D5F|nr:TonB-dependent receptor [Sphingomonas sp.]